VKRETVLNPKVSKKKKKVGKLERDQRIILKCKGPEFTIQMPLFFIWLYARKACLLKQNSVTDYLEPDRTLDWKRWRPMREF